MVAKEKSFIRTVSKHHNVVSLHQSSTIQWREFESDNKNKGFSACGGLTSVAHHPIDTTPSKASLQNYPSTNGTAIQGGGNVTGVHGPEKFTTDMWKETGVGACQ
jgi:hypothetical protein